MFKHIICLSTILFLNTSLSYANQVKVQKLNKNIYVLFGQGGNIAASIGDDGIYIVDDQFAKLSDDIKNKLKDIKPNTPEFVINTHHHGDHTGGNENFAQSGSHIISHNNVRERLKDKHGEKSDYLPVLTFSKDINLHFNDEHAKLIHYKNAHTDGDAIVFFENANVVHMGDIYFNLNSLPFIDVNSGGSVNGVIDAVTDVLTKIDNDTQVIPGHGPISNKQELNNYLHLVKKAKKLVLEAMKTNKTEQAIIDAKPLDSLKLTYSNWLPQERVTKLFFQSLNK